MAPPAAVSLGFKKYGSPIYASSWGPNGILLGGGGGEMACGLKNKIMLVEQDEIGQLSEPLVSVDTDKELPSRLAVHPDGVEMVCGFEESCAHFRLSLAKDSNDPKDLTEVNTHKALLQKSGEQSSVTFSPKGDMLVMGSEEGVIKVFSWPEMKELVVEDEAHGSAISDLVFSADASQLVSVAREKAGPTQGASVWDLEKEEGKLTLKRRTHIWDKDALAAFVGILRGAAYGNEENGLLFTGFNSSARKGPNSYVMQWDASSLTNAGHAVAFKEGKVTALAAAPSGAAFAIGTSEGEVMIFQAKSLAKLARVVCVHGVFVTSLAFSPDSTKLLSTSGDTTAHVCQVPDKAVAESSMLPVFMVLLMAAVAYLIQRYLQAQGYTIQAGMQSTHQ